jgi:hypothetical protein
MPTVTINRLFIHYEESKIYKFEIKKYNKILNLSYFFMHLKWQTFPI